MKKLVKVFGNDKTRISGTGSFPAPQKKDIGREVVVTRSCVTWDGCLGYFADDKSQEKHAFYSDELKEV